MNDREKSILLAVVAGVMGAAIETAVLAIVGVPQETRRFDYYQASVPITTEVERSASSALLFGGDSNTGIYKPSENNILSFATGGVERLRISDDSPNTIPLIVMGRQQESLAQVTDKGDLIISGRFVALHGKPPPEAPVILQKTIHQTENRTINITEVTTAWEFAGVGAVLLAVALGMILYLRKLIIQVRTLERTLRAAP